VGTLLRTLSGYVVLLLTVRVLSRRPGAQLTLFEFVIVFLIGGAVIAATLGDDHSVTNCAMAIIMVGLLHRLVSFVKERSPAFGALVDGTPLVLIRRGEWQREILGRAHIDAQDIMAVARTKGIASVRDIEYAVLERNGSISLLVRRPCR
jgi:uncharacterized membrane protein YcaP (DUF421 family)